MAEPKCSVSNKQIQGNDVVFVQMRFPKRKGITEIKAYIRNEGKLICEGCFNNRRIG